jgi:hypothetical protein
LLVSNLGAVAETRCTHFLFSLKFVYRIVLFTAY